MRYIRSVTFDMLWGIWTALFGALIPILWLFGTPPRAVRPLTRLWARGIVLLLSQVVGLGYRRLNGHNMPDKPGLIVVNHESTWETLVSLILFPNVAIIAKKELLRIPVMGWYLRCSPMIVIDREDAAKSLREMIVQSRSALADGRSVLIFPEGSRKQIGETISFKRGVELLYRALNVPVLPVVVDSGRFWSLGGGVKQSGTIGVSFLPPIAPGMRSPEFVKFAETIMQAERLRIAA